MPQDSLADCTASRTSPDQPAPLGSRQGAFPRSYFLPIRSAHSLTPPNSRSISPLRQSCKVHRRLWNRAGYGPRNGMGPVVLPRVGLRSDVLHLPFLLPGNVVAWIGAEMEFALSQAVASGDTFEHRPSECGHCVQDFLADLDLRDLPGEAAGSESGADDALPPAICVSIRLRWLYPVAAYQAMRPLLRIWAIWRSRTVGSRADCGRITAFFGGGITTSRVSPYRSLSRSRVDAPS